jgi:hypothetical protein
MFCCQNYLFIVSPINDNNNNNNNIIETYSTGYMLAKNLYGKSGFLLVYFGYTFGCLAGSPGRGYSCMLWN